MYVARQCDSLHHFDTERIFQEENVNSWWQGTTALLARTSVWIVRDPIDIMNHD